MPSHCIICLDNSEYMRNGDITPNRLEAQQDAAMKHVNKILVNPESTVGLLTMAGEYPKVVLSLSNDRFSIRAELSSCKIESKPINLIKSLKTGQLAVKKRSVDDRGDRSLLVFVGSPIEKQVDEEEFIKLAKRFKKSNLGVTFVNFAGDKHNVRNQELLQKFVEAVDANENSRLVTVPPGPHILSDMMNQGQSQGTGGSSAFMEDDMDMDPELAAAIRLSLMDQGGAQSQSAPTAQEQPARQEPEPQQPMQDDNIDQDIDDELALAIQLSLQEAEDRERQAQQGAPEAEDPSDIMDDEDSEEGEEEEYDEEAELQRALMLSMQDQNPPSTQPNESVDDIAGDDAFLDDILGNLGGRRSNNDDQMQDEEPKEKKGDNKKEDSKDKKDDNKKEERETKK